MLDFEGIDIDPKFIESSFHYIISADDNNDGLSLEEFIEGIVPKETEHKKREPEYYPEQELWYCLLKLFDCVMEEKGEAGQQEPGQRVQINEGKKEQETVEPTEVK